jgi:hypothetical protein
LNRRQQDERLERNLGAGSGGLVRLLPGLGAVLFAAQLNLMFVRATGFLNDPGTGWHLRAGRLMLEGKRWIEVDPFRFTHAAEPWVTTEWLSEVVLAWIEHIGGLGFLVWFGFSLFALVPLLLFRWMIENQIPRFAAFVYAVGALLILQAHVLARPHVFTYLAFPVMFLLVGPSMREGPAGRQWLALPLLFCAWANLHGGFVAGLIWLGARITGLGFDCKTVRGSVSRWAGLVAVVAAATLVNPYGARLHRQIWRMLFRLETLRYWQEFAPPDLYGPSLLGAFVLGIAFLLLVGLRITAPTGLRWEDLVPTLVFLFFSFKSQRHLFLLVLVASVPICRVVLDMRRALPEKISGRWRRFLELEREGRGDVWAVPLVAIVFAVAFIPSGTSRRLRIGDAHLSATAAEFLRANLSRVQRPITTTGNGGALIYYFFPELRVSFDDRSDFGDRENWRFLGLYAMRPGWRTVLAEGQFDSAILDPKMPLADGLSLLGDWREVYRDSVVVIFLHESKGTESV